MQKFTNFIRNVEIKYYRSINIAKLTSCSPLNIITGPNDIGKSNALRALNLFFNHTNPNGNELEFNEEFSHKRLEVVRKESVKGKQFIQIAVEFNRGELFHNTLPERFKVIKTWYRDNPTPIFSDDLQSYINRGKLDTTIVKARGSLQRFLNRLHFTYIPAIKDKEIFSYILGGLQESIFESSHKAGSSLIPQIEAFNIELQNQAEELRLDFTGSTGIDANISLPISPRDLFQSFNVRTDGLGGEYVSLDGRGDGIRVRFIPAIMNYIAERSAKHHIWGFEEPENSMEFKRSFELSEKMRSSYSKNAQIFLTTHSPAFIDLNAKNQTLYWTAREEETTKFHELTSKSAASLFDGDIDIGLAEELGHIALLNNLHRQLSRAITEAHAVRDAAEALRLEMQTSNKPLLLSEGKTDPLLISEAWKRLRGTPVPFVVRSCNTMPDGEKNEAAGASVLSGALKTIRADAPHLTIGIFDRDQEGIKEYNLDKNFSPVPGVPHAKIHKNKRSVGVLLPHPPSLQHLSDAENLPIEFLFDRECLEKKVEGLGLTIKQQTQYIKVGNKTISSSESTRPEDAYIENGKVWFAEKVMPTLENECFQNFEPLLSTIEILISSADPITTP